MNIVGSIVEGFQSIGRGIASIFGSMSSSQSVHYECHRFKPDGTDSEKLSADWYKVGGDLQASMDRLNETLSKFPNEDFNKSFADMEAMFKDMESMFDKAEKAAKARTNFR